MIKHARVVTNPAQVFKVLRPHITGPKKLIESLAYLICNSYEGYASVRGRLVNWRTIAGTNYHETGITIE